MFVAAMPARAELKVRSPLVTWREFEFEHNGLLTFDNRKSALNGNQSYTYELGYGVTPWWQVELEGETQALAGQNQRLNARTVESTFQILPQGKYWIDLGFFAEFSNSVVRGEPSEIVFGPILQKEAPGFLGATTLHTVNAFVTLEVGHNRGDRTGLFAAAQSWLRLHPLFERGWNLTTTSTTSAVPGASPTRSCLPDRWWRVPTPWVGSISRAR